MADAGVERLADELDALRLELAARLCDVGDAQREARLVGRELAPWCSGFQNESVTFGASTSPSVCSLTGSPSTSRYQATARSTSRVGTDTKSTCSTCNGSPLADRAFHLS